MDSDIYLDVVMQFYVKAGSRLSSEHVHEIYERYNTFDTDAIRLTEK